MPNLRTSQSDLNAMDLSNPYKLRDLTKALIKFSMQDGDRASQELSVRLANIQGHFVEVDSKLNTGVAADDIKLSIKQGMSEIMNCMIELQFFDRISQRMDHATQSLDAESKSELVQKRISGIFTMQDERILYAALLEGHSVDSAVQMANADLLNVVNSTEDDVDLF